MECFQCHRDQARFVCGACGLMMVCSQACGKTHYKSSLCQKLGGGIKRPRRQYNKLMKRHNMFVYEDCLKGYVVKAYLSEGTTGQVYAACKPLEDDCDYAIKVFLFNTDVDRDNFKSEVRFARLLAGDYGIGPDVFGSWTCGDHHGFLVLEKWDGEMRLDEVLEQPMVELLEQEIGVLRELRIVHGDILPKNVLVNRDEQGRVIDVTLTDFSLTMTVDDYQRYPNSLKTTFNYLKEANPYYFRENAIGWEEVLKDPLLLDLGLLWVLYRRLGIKAARSDQ